MTVPLSWSRALTLAERDALLPAGRGPDVDAELAARRLEAWRRDAGLEDDERWRRRLAQQGFDEERVVEILGSPPPRLEEEPAWLRTLRRAYAGPGPRSAGPDWFELSTLEDSHDGVFLETLRPLLDDGWRRLVEDLEALAPPAALERFAELWAVPLPRHLLWMVTRTLILELYVQRLEGTLEGETPEARFESFMASLGPRPVTTDAVPDDPVPDDTVPDDTVPDDTAPDDAALDGALDGAHGMLRLLSTYPVLGRALATRVRQWLDAGLELAERLRDDLSRLGDTFHDGPLGELIALEAGLGDRHEDGRTVARLEFSSGVALIYKPRSLTLDVRYRELVDWLHAEGLEPPLRCAAVLDRGEWGWVEVVETGPCRSEEEVRRFYARQGAHLAILYALEATDFHHENLIASGEHPILIDFESLFQPVFDAQEIAREDLNPVVSTVLRSGLLPRRTWNERGGVDLSGLGAQRGTQTPVRELHRVGTDEMSFVDRMAEFPVGDHLPALQRLDDAEPVEIPLWTMSETILDAFAATYRLLVRLRPQLLGPGGRLERFSDLDTRVILRPTGLYARLVHLSFHPDYLQDALLRERLFDKLSLDGERFWFVEEIVPAERADLHRADFPRFASRTDGRDLVAASGQRFEGFLPRSGLALARARIEALDEEDLDRQLHLARLALNSSRPLDSFSAEEVRAARQVRELPRASADHASPERLIERAEAAAHRLDRLAMRSDDWVSWFHLEPRENAQSLEPVGFDLYSGLGGMALFFAWLGRLGGDGDRWSALSAACLATGRDRYERLVGASIQADGSLRAGPATSLGGYSGIGGWIHCLTHLGALWGDDALLDEAEAVCERVPSLLESDATLDLIAGSAGCAVVLLELHRHRPSPRLLELATACGDRMVETAEVIDVRTLAPSARRVGSADEPTLAWRLPQLDEQPLTGFAHGTAGFAWSLGRLAAATGAERFAATARGALAYERALFSRARGNWPDLRQDRRENGDWGYFHAWCHGAPGIGLSRLGLLEAQGPLHGAAQERARLEDEARAAVESTAAEGFGGSHCLCHGDLGNLELLERAGRCFDDRRLRALAQETTARIVAGIERDGFRCGASGRIEIPGLMTGLAGIGYGLLRAARPDLVPSVLLLETPSSPS